MTDKKVKLNELSSPYTDGVDEAKETTKDIPSEVAALIPFETNVPKTISKSKVDRMLVELEKVTSGGISSYIPMICLGSKCPVFKNCPIARNTPDLLPVGNACPVEDISIGKLRDAVSGTIINQLGEDAYDFVTNIVVDDLVAIIILQTRILGEMSAKGKWTQDVPILMNFTEKGGNGDIQSKMESHPLFDQYMELQGQKRRILDSLIATPEAKVKAKIIAVKDESIVLAERQDKLATLSKAREMIGEYEIVEESN